MILYERARLRTDPPFPKSEGPRTRYWAVYLSAIVLGVVLGLAAVLKAAEASPRPPRGEGKMTIWSWAGVVLVAVGLIGFGLSRWKRSHESVQNGLVLSGCVSCVLNGIILLLITL